MLHMIAVSWGVIAAPVVAWLWYGAGKSKGVEVATGICKFCGEVIADVNKLHQSSTYGTTEKPEN
jgi:hypothetical protein